MARSPWDVPSREEYHEHRPGDDVAADDERFACRRRSRFLCRGVACGGWVCEDGSRSSRGLGGTSEGWKRKPEAEAGTCQASAGAPPTVAAVAVAERRMTKVAVAVVG